MNGTVVPAFDECSLCTVIGSTWAAVITILAGIGAMFLLIIGTYAYCNYVCIRRCGAGDTDDNDPVAREAMKLATLPNIQV